MLNLKMNSQNTRNVVRCCRVGNINNLDVKKLIVENTNKISPILIPELRLQLLDLQAQAEIVDLWSRLEKELSQQIGPPYWAVAWPGGQAIARYILDHPQIVQQKDVLDLASGCAVEGLAAVLAGAKIVTAVDLDPLATAAAQINSQINGLHAKFVAITCDVKDVNVNDFDVVLAGDVCFEKPLASISLHQLSNHKGVALLGDPTKGRNFSPQHNSAKKLQEYIVKTCPDPMLEGVAERRVSVFQYGGSNL